MLWKALDHMLRQAGMMARIRKREGRQKQALPKDRPMSPAVALRILQDVQIGDILLTTVDGRRLRLRRAARPILLGVRAQRAPKGGKCTSNHVLPLDSSPGSPGERLVQSDALLTCLQK